MFGPDYGIFYGKKIRPEFHRLIKSIMSYISMVSFASKDFRDGSVSTEDCKFLII